MTSESIENIDALISDVKSKLHRLDRRTRSEALVQIRKLRKLRSMKTPVSFLRTTTLRSTQALTYDRNELIPLLKIELETLRYYVGDDTDKSFKTFDTEITDAITESNRTTTSITELRRLLIGLREEMDDLKQKYGLGEAIIESVVYWSIFSGTALAIIGLSPLLHKSCPGGSLNFVHWAVFGLLGAIIATVNNIRKKDTYLVAEKEGDDELKKMMHGCFLGMMAAILLYFALHGELIKGRLFPNFTDTCGAPKEGSLVRQNALSILWAIGFGFTGGSSIEGIMGRMRR